MIGDLCKQTNSMRASEAIRTTETLLTLFYGAAAATQGAMGVGLLAMLDELKRRLADQEEQSAYLDYLARPEIMHDVSQLRSIVTGNTLPPAARQTGARTKR
jgi:hypothetical protein